MRMKKLVYLIMLIAVFGLIVPGCLFVVPPSEQDTSGTLPYRNPGMVLVEDFEGYSVSTNLTGGVGGWDTVNPSNTQGYVASDPVSDTNQVGYFRRTGSSATGGRYLDLDTNTIPDNTNGEFSVRFLYNAIPNSVFGLSCLSNPGPASGTGAGMQLSVLFRLGNTGSGGVGKLIYMTDQGHSIGVTLASSLTSNTWYQVWATVDNATDTVSNIYLQGGTEFPTKALVSAGPHTFNIWATVYPNHTDLLTFFVFEQGSVNGVYLDDIQVGVIEVEDDEAPVILNLTANPNPAPVGDEITLTATINDTDTGGSNIASAEYSLDDGNTWAFMSAYDGTFDSSIEAVTANIEPFTESQVVEILVRGTDAAGNTSEEGCVLLAVYDPTAGFVTGGGWIMSPEGAYGANTSLTGKATFGFVSKYQKGANVPTGQTEFQFKVANFNFHSTSYDWLVVAGAKAMYKGTGTINGTGDYKFMLSAIDGQLNGGGSVDKFRIKIWDSSSIIYDNQLGADDNAEPTTAIAGGQIVIHKAK